MRGDQDEIHDSQTKEVEILARQEGKKKDKTSLID